MEKKFQIDFANAISQFEQAIKKFQIRKIIYKTIFRGKGLEFDSYRNFEQNEDASLIDWKASMRTNRLLAKQYVEERDLDIYFVVNISSSMLFGSGKKLKAEYAAEVVIALTHLILNSGDNIGLVLFSDKAVRVLHPSKDKNKFNIIVKLLSNPELYSGREDFDGMVRYVLEHVRSQYSVIILVSDFLRVSQESKRLLGLLGTKFETIAIMVRDKMDESLPDLNYQVVVQDPYSGRQMLVDPAIAAQKYKENTMRQKKFLKETLIDSKIDLLELHTDIGFVIPTVSFLKARAGGE